MLTEIENYALFIKIAKMQVPCGMQHKNLIGSCR